MPHYRAFRNLDNGICKGEVFPASCLKARALAILAERGFIARVAAPPLDVLPGWAERAALLGEMDAEMFFGCAAG